jgi:hypothetical protein
MIVYQKKKIQRRSKLSCASKKREAKIQFTKNKN